MNIVLSFASGLVFGLGLIISGMANPAKVLGFLDLAGSWDPSLILVMAGAISIASVGMLFTARRKLSLLNMQVRLPTARRIDGRLLAGSLVFGVGWGLAGICPGPAFVLFGAGIARGALFVVCMFCGMLIYELFPKSAFDLQRGQG